MSNLQKADPQERRKAIILVLLTTIAAAILVVPTTSRLNALRDWLTEDPSQTQVRFRYVAAALSVGLAVPIVWFSIYSWRLAGRIRRAGQFPPPGLRVLRDTVIVRGARAHRRAAFLQLLSVLLILSTVGFIAALWWLVQILQR